MSGNWIVVSAGSAGTDITLTIGPAGFGRPKSSVVPETMAKVLVPDRIKSGPIVAAIGLPTVVKFQKPIGGTGQQTGYTTVSRDTLVTQPQGLQAMTL